MIEICRCRAEYLHFSHKGPDTRTNIYISRRGPHTIPRKKWVLYASRVRVRQWIRFSKREHSSVHPRELAVTPQRRLLLAAWYSHCSPEILQIPGIYEYQYSSHQGPNILAIIILQENGDRIGWVQVWHNGTTNLIEMSRGFVSQRGHTFSLPKPSEQSW